MKVRKQIAFLTIIIIMLNVFCPYLSFFQNTVQASTGELETYPLILNNLGITQKGANRILAVELAFTSEETLNGFDLQLKVDQSILQPCNKNTGATSSVYAMITTASDYYAGTMQIKTYTAGTSTFHFTATEPAGGFNPVDNGYIPGELGDDAIDVNGQGYPAYYPVLKMFFKVMDSSLQAEDIPLSAFELVPNGVGLPTGLKVNYNNASGVRVSKDIDIGSKGFKEAEKEVASIAVKTNPTNTSYEHGDSIDLTGGVITVTYDDNSEEDIDMTNEKVKLTLPADGKANINNTNIGISYSGKTTTFPITVTDPIVSLAVTSPMNKVEYNHGENFDFTGLALEATKKSGGKEQLTKTSTGVTTSETSANIASSHFTQTSADGIIPISGTQEITFTYQGKEAKQTVIVNDTIDSVALISQPTKTVYKRGENLNLAGAVVKVTLRKWKYN